jgi:hypothetical protein
MIFSETRTTGVSVASPKDADAWFTPGRFAALLAILIGLTFLRVITGQETFFYRDFGVFGYPLAQYHRECFWRGEIPLWNPLNNCGLPFLAQWNTLTLYPLSLFYLLFPLSWSLGVFNLGHMFLAGLGMYFLARRWVKNDLAACVAGVAFAFNGLTWHSLMWPNNIAALGWMPWVVLTVEQAWREGGRRLIIAALAAAMQMLTGAPEIIFLTWIILAATCLAQIIQTLRFPTSSASPMSGSLQDVMRFVSVILLTTGLCAAQLLPFIDLLAHSHRDTGFADSGWAMPVSGLANFLVPLFHTFTTGHGVFVQYDQYWTSSFYLGAGIVALALAAIWRVRCKRLWLLAALAALGLILALGQSGYLYSIARAALPQLGFMRYPIKFIVLAVFAIPLLAAYDVKWWRQTSPASLDRENKTLPIIGWVLLAAMGTIVLLAWKYPMVKDDWPATRHNAAGRAVFLVLILGNLALLPRTVPFRSQLLLRLSLLSLLWQDVYTHAPNPNPTVKRDVYASGSIRMDMKLPAPAQVGEPRAMETLSSINKVRFLSLPDPATDYLSRRLALYDNCNLLDDIPKVDGFYSLYLRETDEVISMLYVYDARHVECKGLKDFLGIAHISALDDGTGSPLDWAARDTFLPLMTAGQKPVFADATNNFDPRETVYLPLEAKPHVAAINRIPVKIPSTQFSAQKLTAQVDSPAPALVVVAQAFYHPWRAYVDGKPTRLWRANHGFQALEIPAGHHEVKLVYEDQAFFWGALISMAALLGCGLFWFWRRTQA